MSEKAYCPHCGQDVSTEEETEFGVFCPKCHNDFWMSESISGENIGSYTYYPEYNMMLSIPR